MVGAGAGEAGATGTGAGAGVGVGAGAGLGAGRTVRVVRPAALPVRASARPSESVACTETA